MALAAAALVVVVVGLAAHEPSHISHAWNDFKSASGASTTNHFASGGGEGRYQFWTAGIDSASSHPFTGSGPGTYQLDWLPRATVHVYTTNAHSLYIETYTELGLVGALLLAAFLATALVVLVRQALRSREVDRVRAAALTAFLVGAAIDWLWQLPAIVAVVLLLIGAGVAPAKEVVLQTPDSGTTRAAMRRRLLLGAATILVSLACIFAAGYPLASDQALSASRNALTAGIDSRNKGIAARDFAAAVSDARTAVSVEPDSAAAQWQLARSLAWAGRDRAAIRAARAATLAEPQGSSNWYLLGELYDAVGRDRAAHDAYARARSLNPQHFPT
jgi:tetratricopeptide (TPR) repeat protein